MNVFGICSVNIAEGVWSALAPSMVVGDDHMYPKMMTRMAMMMKNQKMAPHPLSSSALLPPPLLPLS